MGELIRQPFEPDIVAGTPCDRNHNKRGTDIRPRSPVFSVASFVDAQLTVQGCTSVAEDRDVRERPDT